MLFTLYNVMHSLFLYMLMHIESDSVRPEDIDTVVTELISNGPFGGQSAADSQGLFHCTVHAKKVC